MSARRPCDAPLVHVFERANLGAAPFAFKGVQERWFVAVPGAPKQPGSSCDYCGNGIAFEFWLRGRDGRRFKVGSECINKSGDRGLRKAIAPALRAQAHAKDDARIAAARATLESRPELRGVLQAQPHPYPFMAEKGYTLADFVDFNLRHAGRSGMVAASRVIERASK